MKNILLIGLIPFLAITSTITAEHKEKMPDTSNIGSKQNLKKDFTNAELKSMLDFVKKLALKAGKVITELRNDNLKFDYKNKGTELVTSADLKSDEIIRTELTRKYPGIEIYSEESHSDSTDFYAPLWIYVG